ncbi:MAG: ATP-binding protein [Candidatus Hodarchaeota archaeon]
MCQFCIQHGEGKIWYKHAKNYARHQYKKLRQKRHKGPSPEAQANAAVAQAIMTKSLNPKKYPELKAAAERLALKHHGGQVLPFEHAEIMIELSSPIALIDCVCRRANRATLETTSEFKDDELMRSCMGLGVGILKWEEWSERYKGGIDILDPKEARDWLEVWRKRGMVPTLMTFGTPYIGGLCMCDYPICGIIRNRLDYDIKQLLKGEFVAVLDQQKCRGCLKCMTRCHFGAITHEVARGKAYINMKKCFGCGLCRDTCPEKAITLQPRKNFPILKNMW